MNRCRFCHFILKQFSQLLIGTDSGISQIYMQAVNIMWWQHPTSEKLFSNRNWKSYPVWSGMIAHLTRDILEENLKSTQGINVYQKSEKGTV